MLDNAEKIPSASSSVRPLDEAPSTLLVSCHPVWSPDSASSAPLPSLFSDDGKPGCTMRGHVSWVTKSRVAAQNTAAGRRASFTGVGSASIALEGSSTWTDSGDRSQAFEPRHHLCKFLLPGRHRGSSRLRLSRQVRRIALSVSAAEKNERLPGCNM